MVVKKKVLAVIISVLLFVAVCAPCALGVSADSTITPYNHMSRSEQYALYGWSVDPDYFVYESGTLMFSITSLGYNYYKKYDGPAICVWSCQFNSSMSFSCPSLICPTSSSTSDSCVFYRPHSPSDFISSSSAYSYEGSSYYWSMGLGSQDGPEIPDVANFPLYTDSYSTWDSMLVDVLSQSGFSSSEPAPDIEPSDPSSEGGDLLSGFTWVQNIGYYASFSPLLNANTFEPVYLSVKRFSNMPYEQVTDSFFLSPSSSNGSALLFGQKANYNNIISRATVFYGVAAMLVTSPSFRLDQSSLSQDYTASVYFANGDNPSASGYSQYDISNLGLHDYTVRVWSIDYNDWSRIIMCRFYFVLDLGVSTEVFPTDTISIEFKSTSIHTHDVYWTPFDFRIQYALRDSESDPLPESVSDYNPATGSPYSNGGFNSSGSSVSDDLNQEATWYNNYANNLISNNLGGVLSSLTDLVDQGLFGTNIQALESLKNALTYSGNGGTLYLPSTTIPFGDIQLHLWDSQPIPFDYYINNIPSQYCTIISFLVVVGGWFAFTAIAYSSIRKLFNGDLKEEHF